MTRLGWAVCLAVSLVLGALASTMPGLRGFVTNSDGLLPAALMHNLLHDPATVAGFQLPRVPSLVPDLAVYAAVSAAIPEWRLVIPAYAGLSFAALVGLGGLVVAEVAGMAALAAAATVLGLGTAALAISLAWDAGGAWPMILMPVIHSGPTVLLAWAGLLVAWRLLTGGGSWLGWVLVAIGAAGTLSDRLFLPAFLAPVLAGVAAIRLTGGGAALPLRRVAVLAAAACAVGIAMDIGLFHSLLVRQGDVGVHPLRQWALLPRMAGDAHMQGTAAAVLAVALVPLAWRGRSSRVVFWWAAAAAGSLACLALTPLAYLDGGAVRYDQPAWWWAVLMLAAWLLRAAPRRGAAAALALGAAAAFLVAGRTPPEPGTLRRWHDPVADCLQQAHDAGLIHAGLAGYWSARAIEASSDWRLQLGQLGEAGRLYTWGNNAWYDTHGPDGAAPRRDYVVLRGLDPARIGARFGPPDARFECGGSEVWRWLDPSHLARALAGPDPR